MVCARRRQAHPNNPTSQYAILGRGPDPEIVNFIDPCQGTK